MKIPLLDLRSQFDLIEKEVLEALRGVCRSSQYSQGPETEAFEQEFSKYCNSSHTVTVNSGTSALHLALKCLNIGPGDEVITVPMTFIATTWAISYVGARPVFVDIDARRRTLDPGQLEAAITAKTKAIMPVHLFGTPADMGPILKIADKHHIPVIEDAAQAHGARYGHKMAGALGRIGIFSFYPGKNLGAYGEGGALITNDPAIAQRARSLRDHAQTKRYHHEEIGYNYRMDSFQAAILRIKLRRLDEWNKSRARVATEYSQLLPRDAVELPAHIDGVTPVWHVYAIETDSRDELRKKLADRDIGTGLHYPIPVHLQTAYKSLGHKVGDFPVSEKFAGRCLSLPIYPEMTTEMVQCVSQAILA